ncbi:MAG: nucleotide exchange factor GrpE [Fimbriimonadaceae bacterium]|nr:nucleotide exchange factor GrpE [Fimbriimonadaceae bacterium]
MQEETLEPEAQAENPVADRPADSFAEADDDAAALQAALEAAMEENRRLLYQAAELQNMVRRIRSQAESDRRYAAEGLLEALLPVLDGFERTLGAAAKGATVESLTDGVRVIDKQMRKALEDAGLQRIVALGAAFDPELHEAVATVEDEELDHETVVDELTAGYRLHDRVLRPAQVRVSQKP